MPYPPATEAKINEVATALERYGRNSIIVLSGVPGTGKTFVAEVAAQRHCGHPLLVKSIQFHQSYAYEDFMEGLRPTPAGGFVPAAGVFLDWNDRAQADQANRYCLLIEEFTRANIASVLGELMTYIEYRNRSFTTPLTRRQVTVADNLVVLATMNPRDRSALEVDDALIRRLRIIDCPPDTGQLAEMLRGSLPNDGQTQDETQLIAALVRIFEDCEQQHPGTYRELMPFGHGIFAGVEGDQDLFFLWHQRIKHLLERPLVTPHPFTETIKPLYLWKAADPAWSQPVTPSTTDQEEQPEQPVPEQAGQAGQAGQTPDQSALQAAADPESAEQEDED
ncbi:MAG: McrB family protein [Actinomycetota bacterium]